MNLGVKKANRKEILEFIYLLILAAFIIFSVLNTTKFIIIWPDYFYEDLKVAILLFVLAKAGMLGNYSKKEMILIVLLGAILLFNVNRNGYGELETLFLLIIGAKGIDFKRIAKIYFITVLVLLLITIPSALTGKIENLIYFQEGRRSRMALGIGYPTDFSAYIFYGILSYMYIRGKKLKYFELIGSALLGVGVYYITDARLNTICILMTSVIFTYIKWRTENAKKRNTEYKANKVWSLVLALAPVICAAFMICCSILYSSGNKVTNFLDRLLNYRLYQGNKAIEIYGFTLWGQHIPMQGYGGTTELPKHYFFLDSSYLSIVMQYGLLVLGTVLLIWITISFRARAEKEWGLLWIIAILSVQCMVEHHMLDIAYNPFIWAVFADIARRKERFQYLDKRYARKGIC